MILSDSPELYQTRPYAQRRQALCVVVPFDVPNVHQSTLVIDRSDHGRRSEAMLIALQVSSKKDSAGRGDEHRLRNVHLDLT